MPAKGEVLTLIFIVIIGGSILAQGITYLSPYSESVCVTVVFENPAIDTISPA